jgi:CCR4-NOT transcriptional complex subunit CAF120
MRSKLAQQTPGMYWPAPPMNPYAQQQAMMAAQMAYQNSIYMAMSAAGSQVGTPNLDVGPPTNNNFDARSASPMMPMAPMSMPMSGAGNPYMSMYGGYAPSMPGQGFGMQGMGMLSPGAGGGGGMYPMPGSVMGGATGTQTPPTGQGQDQGQVGGDPGRSNERR